MLQLLRIAFNLQLENKEKKSKRNCIMLIVAENSIKKEVKELGINKEKPKKTKCG